MTDDDIFGIVYGSSPNPTEEELAALRSFEWDDIIAKIEAGQFSNKISYVLNTHDIPSRYDGEAIRQKFMLSYVEHMKKLIGKAETINEKINAELGELSEESSFDDLLERMRATIAAQRSSES